MHVGMHAIMVRVVQRLAVMLITRLMSGGSSIGVLQLRRMIVHGRSHSSATASEDDGDHQEDEKADHGSLHLCT